MSSNTKIYVEDFLNARDRIDLQIRLIAGEKGIGNEVNVGDINRPGLTLAGFYDFFAYDRIQIFGMGENAFLNQLSDKKKREVYNKFFSYPILCCIFTHDMSPDDYFITEANKKGVPVFITKRATTRFISLLMHLLDEVFSPITTIHSTFIDVHGVGVLLIGKSGVGKSECALELIERGHRLVADDMVEIRKVDETLLMGRGTPLLKHHMEIRGLGIINVRDIFGIGSIRNNKRIELVALLEEWSSEKEYDRLGFDEAKYSILDIDIPYIVIPVRPGRNIPIILETAALNQRLKKLGVYSARELDKKIQEWIKSEKTK